MILGAAEPRAPADLDYVIGNVLCWRSLCFASDYYRAKSVEPGLGATTVGSMNRESKPWFCIHRTVGGVTWLITTYAILARDRPLSGPLANEGEETDLNLLKQFTV